MKRLALTTLLALAAQAAAQTDPAPAGVAGDGVEVIRERDAAGRVRVQREVRLDERGDYVNHGVWRSWDESQQLVGQGRYAWGKPHGAWSRWASAGDSPLLETYPYCDFEGPFLSQFEYRNGRAHGVWSVFDAAGTLVSEVCVESGDRHGETTLWAADGSVYRRSRFERGVPVGDVEQRDDAGELRIIATYDGGRRHIERSEDHPTGGPRIREAWLGPLTTVADADDPWRVRLARYATRGEAIRHGRREAWWPSGQRKLVAEYRQGRAVGTARWWHANGQLALEGSYEDGLADGSWSWWRENGVRAAACRYAAGKPVEAASLWAANGVRIEPRPAESGARQRLAGRSDAPLIR